MSIQATRNEKSMPLPGDEFIENPKAKITYAVYIESRPENIFPWFKQLGCRRAGWYSYDYLDNARVPSARAILPEFQSLKKGDVVPASPTDRPVWVLRCWILRKIRIWPFSHSLRFPL